MKEYRSQALSLVFACSGIVIAAACNGAAPSDSIGTVQAALSAIGPDGATYSIPTTAALMVQGPTSSVCETLTSAATQTFSLPANAYTFFLSASGCTQVPANPGANVPFTLGRAGDGGATTVGALLVSPEQTVNVTAGTSTPLVFQFTIEQLGTITTGNGSVAVSINASDASVSSPASGDVAGSFTSTVWTPGPGATAAVNTLLSPSASGSITIGVTGLSAFATNISDSACAAFTPTITTTSSSAAYAALLQEVSAPGAVGTICFYDEYSANPNEVTLTVTRTGTPATSTFATALSSDGGASPDTFSLQLQGQPATPVNDGSSLSFAQFATPESLTGVSEAIYIQTASQTLGSLHAGGLVASLSLETSGGSGLADAGEAGTTEAALGVPTFSPPSETSTQTIGVTLSSTAAAATICYTTDGTTPACSSGACSGSSKAYAAGQVVNVTTTTSVSAIACEAGMLSSAVSTQTYTISVPAVAAPTFNPPGELATAPISLTLLAQTGATVCYTTDGSVPVCSSGACFAPSKASVVGMAVPIDVTTTVNALACEAGAPSSIVVTQTYTIIL